MEHLRFDIHPRSTGIIAACAYLASKGKVISVSHNAYYMTFCVEKLLITFPRLTFQNFIKEYFNARLPNSRS